MTWEEAKKAFADNAAVVYLNPVICREPIVCPRIAEITLYRGQDGQVKELIGAMDRNENCVYRDLTKFFTRRQ